MVQRVNTLAARWAEHEMVIRALNFDPRLFNYMRHAFYAGATEAVKMLSEPLTEEAADSEATVREAAGKMADIMIGMTSELQTFHATCRSHALSVLRTTDDDEPETLSDVIARIMDRAREMQKEQEVSDIDPKRGFGD